MSTPAAARGRPWSSGLARAPASPASRERARSNTAVTHACRDRPLGAVGASELDQQANAIARGSLADIRAAEVPCRAGDVEVRPRSVADELRQERASDDRPRLARFGRVVEVGICALDELVVLLVQRQAPHDLARSLARALQAPRELVVV